MNMMYEFHSSTRKDQGEANSPISRKYTNIYQKNRGQILANAVSITQVGGWFPALATSSQK
jgi:hypothetical protein